MGCIQQTQGDCRLATYERWRKDLALNYHTALIPFITLMPQIVVVLAGAVALFLS
jgi:hypothetical protein